MSGDYWTIGQLAQHFGEPHWRVRRVVDAINAELPRAGLYRLVPANLVAEVGQRLRRIAEDGEGTR